MELIRAADLDTSPIRYVVDRIIPEGPAVGYVWGRTGSGKSAAFGIELGLDVGNGARFLGHATVQGPVVYAVGEGLPGLGIRKEGRMIRQQRDAAVAIAAGIPADSIPPYTDENLFIIDEPFDVRVDADRRGISATMREAIGHITGGGGGRPCLLILDSAVRFCGGANLASHSQASRFADGLKVLSDVLECVVLVIAHPTAANSKMFGAGCLAEAADFVIEVTPESAMPGRPKVSSVHSRKSKDSAGFDSFSIVLENVPFEQPAEDEDGNPVPGEMVTVEAATVRLLESTSSAQLPVRLAGGTRPRRTGIRPRHGMHAVPGGGAALAASQPGKGAPLITGPEVRPARLEVSPERRVRST